MKISLTITQEPEKRRGLEFDKPDQFLVERVQQTNFQLSQDDRYIPRRHFILKISSPACCKKDLQNTNGIRVDGTKVVEVELREGDIIIDLEVDIEDDGVEEFKASNYIRRDCHRHIAKKDSRTVRDLSCDRCTPREPKKVGTYEISGGRILEESGRCGIDGVCEKTWHEPAHRLEDLEKTGSGTTNNQTAKKLSQRGIKPPKTLLATDEFVKLDAHTISDWERFLINAPSTLGLSFPVRGIANGNAGIAINWLTYTIKEMEAKVKSVNGLDTSRYGGMIESCKAERYIRKIELSRGNAEKRKLLTDAISCLGKAAVSFDSLGDSRSSRMCEGRKHLYSVLGLIYDNSRKQTYQKIKDAVFEIGEAKRCYESISDESGMDLVTGVDKILNCATEIFGSSGKYNPKMCRTTTTDSREALNKMSDARFRNIAEIFGVDAPIGESDRRSRRGSWLERLAHIWKLILKITAIS